MLNMSLKNKADAGVFVVIVVLRENRLVRKKDNKLMSAALFLYFCCCCCCYKLMHLNCVCGFPIRVQTPPRLLRSCA